MHQSPSGQPLACFSVHSNTHADTHIKLAHFKEGERAGGGGAKATPLDSICSAEFNMSRAGGALFFPAGLFPGDTSISGRWLGRQREAGPTAQPHGVLKPTHTHTQSAVTHTQISTVASTHMDLHTDAFIHTRVALRQRTPCLTTTTDLVKQWGGAGEG